MITERPDQSDTPQVVPRRLFQIEGGVFHGERDHAGEDLSMDLYPSLLLRYGLAETFELRLGIPGFAIETTEGAAGTTRADGLVDATAGFKVAITEQRGAVPAAAFIGTLLLPVGSDDFSTDRIDPAFRFAFGNSLTRTLSLTYNIGMLWLTGQDTAGTLDTRSFLDWTATLGYSASSRMAVFGELFGLTGVSADDRTMASAGTGLTWLMTPRLQLDGRVTVGLSSEALDWTAGVGASYRFPRFEPVAPSSRTPYTPLDAIRHLADPRAPAGARSRSFRDGTCSCGTR